jgi:hypothetical protein
MDEVASEHADEDLGEGDGDAGADRRLATSARPIQRAAIR